MSIGIKSNILHDFASYTYSFTLYMVPPSEYNEVKNLGDISLLDIHTRKFSKKVVLLQTGATAISINNVTITSSTAVTGTDVTNIRVQALQTKGFSFFESILKACEICGVSGDSLQSAQMFLELTFVGMDDNGNTKNNIFTITYPVMFQDVKTSITNTGASYDIILSASQLVSKEDSFSTLPSIITMTDVKDVSSFFKRFESAINEAYKKDTTAGQAQVNTCKFIVDPDIVNFKMKANDGTNPVFDYSMNYDDSMGPSFNLPSGTSIPKIVEGVLANVPEIQKLVLTDGIVSMVPHIEPVVTNGEYIPTLNAYSKNIIWYVRLKPQIKPISTKNFDSRKELQSLIDNGDISKAYNYYFTGENTEVISMDIDFSQIFATTITSYAGILQNYANDITFAPSSINDKDEMLERESSETTKTNNQYQASPAYTDNSGSDVFYVDDYEKVDENLLKNMATSFVKKPNTQVNNSNVTSNVPNSNREEYMTVLNNIRQLQYNPAILGKVDMEIRGDPYWLTPRNVYIKSEESISNPRRLNIFYIKVGFPFDETNNKLVVDNYISRLYQTNSVISEFNNGKFIQKLSGSVIQSISRTDIEQELKNDV